MPITFYCICGSELSVPDTHAGKKGKCPHCNAIIDIPTESKIMPSPVAVGGGASEAEKPVAPRRGGRRGGTRGMRRGGGSRGGGGRGGATRSMKRGGGRGARGATSKYSRGRGRRDEYDDYDDEEPYYAAKKSSNTPLIIALVVVGAIVVLGGGFFIAGSDTRDLRNTVFDLFDAVNSGKGDWALRIANPDEVMELRPKEKSFLSSNPSLLTKGLTGSPAIISIDGVPGEGNRRWVQIQANGGKKRLQFAKLGGAWYVCLTSTMKNQLITHTSAGYYQVNQQGDTWGGGSDVWGTSTTSPRPSQSTEDNPLDRRNW